MPNIKNIIKGPIDFTQIPDIPKNPNIPDIDLSEEISNIYLNYQGLKEYHSKVKNALNTKVNLEDYNSYKEEIETKNKKQDGLINGINNRIAIYNKYTGDITTEYIDNINNN